MTARDNSLIARATAPTLGAVPTVLAGEIRVFLAALKRLGYDERALLEAAGIQRADLDDPDRLVSCHAYEMIVRRAQLERPVKNLEVRIARETPMGAYPLLDYLVVTSDTVGEAVAQLAKYLRLVGTPVTLRIVEERDRILVLANGSPSILGALFTLSLTVFHLTTETNGLFRATAIHLAHMPDDVDDIERLLGCPVRARSEWTGLELSPQVWRLPLRRRDPILRTVLEHQADAIASTLTSSGDVASDVRRVLSGRVLGGDTTIQAVARHLATTPRTLQRKLAGEGTTYQELLDTTRREAAAAYLANSTLAICEIAYLLGYSEPAAFHRAFKRWHEETPQTFRARQHRRSASVH